MSCFSLHETYVDCLDRRELVAEIKHILTDFDKKRNDLMFKKGIYIYGPSGSGKTQLVLNVLREMNYNVVKYDTGDVRNKALIDTITRNNMSDRNVLSMFHTAATATATAGATTNLPPSSQLAILMDEIDGMNHSDKGGINALIKVIRQKKTKKQKMEEMTSNPIICIGNYYTDKKVRELMRVCHTFELKKPTEQQIARLIPRIYPLVAPTSLQLAQYVQGDLRKLNSCLLLHKHNSSLFFAPETNSILMKPKSYVDNVKCITKKLISRKHRMEDHNIVMNDTDRTIVALLWHENITDAIQSHSATTQTEKFQYYQEILQTICFSDYMDRITFQSQIWQFNELTSLMKTFSNHNVFHEKFPFTAVPAEIRFTKVLTKYSTEYNNILFIYGLCQQLDLDQNDLFAFFHELRAKHGTQLLTNNETLSRIEKELEPYDVGKLFIRRMFRYMDATVRRELTTSSSSSVAACNNIDSAAAAAATSAAMADRNDNLLDFADDFDDDDENANDDDDDDEFDNDFRPSSPSMKKSYRSRTTQKKTK